jgi:zinc and cadmium transporter
MILALTRKAIAFNILSSSTSLIGAVGAYLILPAIEWIVPYMLAFSAASFIYIALADLVPGRRHTHSLNHLATELGAILAGVGSIPIIHLLTHAISHLHRF